MAARLPELTVRRGDSRRIVDLIDRINLKTQTQPPSEKLQAQFDYMKTLVDRLREEQKELKKAPVEPQELKSDWGSLRSLEDLIAECFKEHADNEPLRASTVTKRVRSITGKRYTRTNLDDDLKDSTRFQLKTSHNVAFVVRCPTA